MQAQRMVAWLLEWRNGERAAMRIPPTWQVEMLRKGEVDMKTLKELIVRFKGQLEPYKIPVAQRN